MSNPKTEPPKKSKSKPPRSKQTPGTNAPKLKVVIRRLPPNLPEAIFWQSVSQWVTETTTSWKLYVKGKQRTKLNKENTPSRAYIEFLTPEAVISFNQGYNGHLFRDKQGNESIAVVEYAPFQKVPHALRKVDHKIGTIESDEHYISFLNTLNKPPEPTPDINELVSQPALVTEPSSTPLLDALKAAKESSTIKGYHSHYHDQPNQSLTRAQQLEDEQAFNRKAPLLPKSQQDLANSVGAAETTPKDEKGKEKEGGGKKKNKQKEQKPASSPAPGSSARTKQPPPPTQSGPATTSGRPVEAPRPRVTVGSRGGLLAALGATTEARTAAANRNPTPRQREPSVGGPNEVSPPPAPAASLPAGVLAIPVMPAPVSGSKPEPSHTSGKSRRGGKPRTRGGARGNGEGSDAPSNPTEMPRIDDPGQALPPATSAQRGRGNSRGRGVRGRGRGRGGASGVGDQPGPATA